MLWQPHHFGCQRMGGDRIAMRTALHRHQFCVATALSAGSTKKVRTSSPSKEKPADGTAGTCNYNHDFGNSMALNGLNNASVYPFSHQTAMLNNGSSKKSLNVDSPAFTPKTSNAQLAKIGISPKAAAAATFTPRGSGMPLHRPPRDVLTDVYLGSVTPAANAHSKDHSGDFSPPQIFQPAQQTFQEFFPGQSFLGSQQSVSTFL